jgi:hypothetical protein
MKNLLLTLAFLLELMAFAGFAGLGLLASTASLAQLMIAVLLFVLLIVFWSLFMSPKATHKFSLPWYYLAKAIVYGLAGFTISAKLGTGSAITFGALVIADEAALYRQPKPS